jgi:hypothetical protein
MESSLLLLEDHVYLRLSKNVWIRLEPRLVFRGKTKYRTRKVLYCMSRGKFWSFLVTPIFFAFLINKLDFYGTNASPILTICTQYSLVFIVNFQLLWKSFQELAVIYKGQ